MLSEGPYLARRRTNRTIADVYPTALFLLTTLFAAPLLHAQSIPLTGPQQLVFTGLLGSSNTSQFYAQFNAVQSDASGNLISSSTKKTAYASSRPTQVRPTSSPKPS
jgi:hypothetical protein